jgi:hypothetical protein
MSKIKLVSRFSRAKELDGIIDASLAALVEIHKHEYFIELGFERMQDYLKSKGKSYLQSWQTMAALEVQAALPDVKIPNVATALELKKVALPQRRQVVSNALEESDGKLSAPAIKKAVASLPELRKEAVKAVKLPKDGTGCDIPPEIQEFWSRNEEIDHLLSCVKKARIATEKAMETGDKLFNGVDKQGVISRLKGAEEELACAKSYAVCPDCNGVFSEGCQTCKGRGTLSKFWWERQPEEIKALRES